MLIDLLFINQPLIPGALTRVIMTATEAKCAALQELAVNSRYSDGLATGTGTDQIAVAAMETGAAPLTSAGKHAKLGELIGLTVFRAIKQTLANQNQLTPAGQCSAKIHLERFGLDRRAMLTLICRYLEEDEARLLEENFSVLERDPLTVAAVAAVAAMVHLRDKFAWGILPPACWSEVMGAQAVQVACSVGGDFRRLSDYRDALAPTRVAVGNGALVELVCRAMALGFADKWKQSCSEAKGGRPTHDTE